MAFYRTLLYGGIAVAIIFLILSIVLFFVLKIPTVIGNLTGSTQKRRIAEIRKTGYETVSKDKAIHDSTSKITVRDAELKRADGKKVDSGDLAGSGDLAKPKADMGFGTANADSETELLSYAQFNMNLTPSESGTEVLGANEISSGSNEEATDLLKGNTGELLAKYSEDETAVLGNEDGMYDTDLDVDVTDVLAEAFKKGERRNDSYRERNYEAPEVDDQVKGSENVDTKNGEEYDSVITDEDGEDITSVLRGGPGVPGAAPKNLGGLGRRDDIDDTDYTSMITVMYSVTVVNTGEDLGD